MWNDESSFGGGQGGFMNSSQVQSPIVQKERKNQFPVPVTIRMIKECQEDHITIEDINVQFVSIVGIVKSVKVLSTHATYSITDTTGTIDATHYFDTDTPGEAESQIVAQDTYVRIYGNVKRSHDNNKQIIIINIAPTADDPNIITSHLLETIYVPLKLKECSMKKVNPSSTFSGAGAASIPMDTNNTQGLTGPTKLVYQIIKNDRTEQGVHKNLMYESLKGKVTQQHIEKILEDLSNEGLIFCTTDEDHYRTSDNY